MRPFITFLCFSLLATAARAQATSRDVVYFKKGGAAFTLDVIRPANPNRAAVIFVLSGGWVSNHARLTPGGGPIAKVFLDNGFTVFQVVHGSQPRYTVTEIVEQVQAAVTYVHAHAADYGVEPSRIGLSGISSGGHLALMAAGAPDTPLRAVAAIAPPTDLANWGRRSMLYTDMPQFLKNRPGFGLASDTPTREAIAASSKLSPISLVSSKYPPTFIAHGDSDTVVPLQQGQVMAEALAKAGVVHSLEVLPRGGHVPETFTLAMEKALTWFRERLLK